MLFVRNAILCTNLRNLLTNPTLHNGTASIYHFQIILMNHEDNHATLPCFEKLGLEEEDVCSTLGIRTVTTAFCLHYFPDLAFQSCWNSGGIEMCHQSTYS